LSVLEAQLATRESFEDKILGTVYWALGVIVTLGVALLGFGWFGNFKAYERDKKAIHDELAAMIALKISEIEKSNARVISNAVKTAVDNELRGLQDQIRTLRISSIDREIEMWQSRDVQTNVLRSICDAIEIAVVQDEGSDGYWTGRNLDKMNICLDSLKSSSVKPDSNLVARATSSIESTRRWHAVVANRLLTKLQNLDE